MAKKKDDLVKTSTGYYDPVTKTEFDTTTEGHLVNKETGEIAISDEAEMYAVMYDRAPEWKTPFNHDTDRESLRTGSKNLEPTKCQQHLAAETDINNILAKFIQTGHLPLTGDPIYQDLTEEFDLQKRMVTGWEVEEAWNRLSAETRNILRDPRTFVEYIDHALETGDLQELRKLGLAKPLITPTPDLVMPGARQAAPGSAQTPVTPVGGTPAPATGETPPPGA